MKTFSVRNGDNEKLQCISIEAKSRQDLYKQIHELPFKNWEFWRTSDLNDSWVTD